MTTYEIYKRLLDEKGVKTADVCRATGIAQASMSQWKKGEINLKLETLSRIADYFGISVFEFYENDGSVAPAPLEPETVKIKVLGTVPAGVPIEAVEDIIGEEEISMKLAQTGEFFGLRIKGDSMEPRIFHGDTVIVRQQDDVDNGDVAIVMINGSDATCKKVEKHDNGIMLVPLNRKYEEKFYTNEDIEKLPVRIIGKVVELRAKF